MATPTREEIEIELLRGLKGLQEWETRRDLHRRDELEGIRQALGTVTTQVQLIHTRFDAAEKRNDERFAGLSSRLETLEKRDEDTGVHTLQTAEKRADFWSGFVAKVAVGVVVGVVTVFVTYLVVRPTADARPAAAASH